MALIHDDQICGPMFTVDERLNARNLHGPLRIKPRVIPLDNSVRNLEVVEFLTALFDQLGAVSKEDTALVFGDCPSDHRGTHACLPGAGRRYEHNPPVALSDLAAQRFQGLRLIWAKRDHVGESVTISKCCCRGLKQWLQNQALDTLEGNRRRPPLQEKSFPQGARSALVERCYRSARKKEKKLLYCHPIEG